MGRAEVDDVICNTLGSAIGGISYAMTHRKDKHHLKEGEKY